MPTWSGFASALKKSFDDLVESGLQNVKVRMKTDKQICLEITNVREYIVFLDGLTNKYPLRYLDAKDILWPPISFPILDGSTLDFLNNNKEPLRRTKFVSFFRSPPASSTKQYRYNAKKELVENFGAREEDILLIPYEGTVVTEEMASLLSLLFFRNRGFIVTRYDQYFSRFAPGLPDQIFWRNSLVDELNKRGFLPFGGTLSELTLCRFMV